MLTLGNLLILMLLGTAGAWLWHAHGLNEFALAAARQHCAKAGVELLDDNVALRRLALLRDAQGHRRLARIYNFEFTVTGEQRHDGRLVMFGRHVARIELAPHPYPDPTQSPVPLKSADVVKLDQWRRDHQRQEQQRR